MHTPQQQGSQHTLRAHACAGQQRWRVPSGATYTASTAPRKESMLAVSSRAAAATNALTDIAARRADAAHFAPVRWAR
jgi:hypothetical protein